MSRSPHRGCRDWHSTRRAFLLGRATEVVPIPADALDGLEAEFERSGGMTRRNLLERGVGLWIGAAVLGGLSTRSVLEAASAQAAAAPDATILVSLYLDGGNDGLNTLVPLADPLYADAAQPRRHRARHHPADPRTRPTSAGTRPSAG